MRIIIDTRGVGARLEPIRIDTIQIVVDGATWELVVPDFATEAVLRGIRERLK